MGSPPQWHQQIPTKASRVHKEAFPETRVTIPQRTPLAMDKIKRVGKILLKRYVHESHAKCLR